MPDLAISNTSPLFYLHRLKRLDLLQKLYQKVIVPEAVVDELKAGRNFFLDSNVLMRLLHEQE